MGEKDSSTKKDYFLGSGLLSSVRLNLQHYILREAFEYNIHPRIPLDHDQLRIADVATGTGVWLFDIARHLPADAQLDGFDITDAQFPHPNSWPKNVTLKTLDAKSPPPDYIRGRYDVVNVRLMLAAVENADPSPILKHCFELLKPGGYLQWIELDPLRYEKMPRPDNKATPNLDKMIEMVGSTKDYTWIAELSKWASRYGFKTIESTVVRDDEKPWLSHMLMQGLCFLCNEIASTIMDKDPASAQVEKFRSLSKACQEEYLEGSYYSHCHQLVVFQKQS